ncbi:MAG: Hsp20/alpha crystallin family protein [Candidatus Marinimicrobia bacterium]|nr:Hsp20/alpha crystallin family protein [Candidatus Neomarinimicrobiota bacterium]MCF6267590.1 Hsp20/alpha crystallin family protein [Desulfuromusa sp.]
MSDKQMTTSKNESIDHVEKVQSMLKLTPAVDIYETPEELVLLADLPGIGESSLKIEVSRGVLTLEGEIQDTDTETQRSYYRQFTLSERIDADSGKATMKDGVLTLRLPKNEEAKPKKIAVKTFH